MRPSLHLVVAVASVSLALSLVRCDDAKSPQRAESADAGSTAGATGAPSPVATAPLDVVAINTPLATFAKRIGGDLVTVTMPVPDGRDPAFWAPTSDDIVRMQGATLILLNGAGHERWRASASLPEARVVATADGFKDRWIETSHGTTHSHGLEGEHTHKGTAFTTWIDPNLAIVQAESIRAALAKALPSAADTFAANFAVVKSELEDLDSSIAAAIHDQQSLPVVFSHPVYDYLVDRYALNARSVHWEPDAMPGERDWASFTELLREHPARWMVWEDEPDPEIRARLESVGVQSIVFRPAGNLGPVVDGNSWFAAQRENALELAKVYE